MAQRFPGPGPSPGPSGPPPQRYQQPQNPGMRQYSQQNFPVSFFLNKLLIINNETSFKQRAGYNNPPAALNTSGGTMIQRPSGTPYSPMRGQMQAQSGGKRPADNRAAMQQKR